MCERIEIDVTDTELSLYEDENNTNIKKCLASGYFFNAAKYMKNGQYRTLKAPHSVMIHPHSLLFKDTPAYVIYTELVLTTKEYMRNVCEITPEWLYELAPHYYKEADFKEENKPKMPKGKG